MPLSWVVRDALGQLNVLVARKGQLELGGSIRPTARSADLTTLSPAGVGDPASLADADVKAALRSLQQFLLAQVHAIDLAEVSTHLMTLAKQYEAVDRNNKAPIVEGGGTAPSSSDKKETIDDKKDSSISFLVLDTMCAIMTSASAADRASLESCKAVIPFSFAYLAHTYSSAVRHAAARLLGLLSTVFLAPITALFVEKFAAAKKDQQKREFVSYQRAIMLLDFSVAPAHARTTIDYLTALLAEMKHVDRGVLRQEICTSLDAIYRRILSPTGPDAEQREAEWANFVRGEKGVEDWHVLYERIYSTVGKWSGKAKHTLFCLELLASMTTSCCNQAFFASKKRHDVLGDLIKGVRKETGEPRKHLMRILTSYLDTLPPSFRAHEPQELLAALRILFPALLPKKTKPAADELPELLEMLTAAGRVNLASFVNEVVVEVLRPQSAYYTRQKALLLQALAALATEGESTRREMAAFHLQLGPLVCAHIDESASSAIVVGGEDVTSEDKQVLLLRAALKCFPAIRHPKVEHVSCTAAAVILLATHSDREISGSVAQALQQFISLDLSSYFMPTLHALVDLLKIGDIDARPDQLLKVCNIVSLLCNTLADHLTIQEAEDAQQQRSPRSPDGASPPPSALSQQFSVTANAWLALREHIEAVVLLRLCHPEGWVRSELLRMLQSFSRPCFRRLERMAAAAAMASPRAAQELCDIPFLIDYLLPESAGVAAGSPEAAAFGGVILPTAEVFYLPLFTLLSTPSSYDAFHGLASYAFSFVHKALEQIHPFLEQSRTYTRDLVIEDWYLLWRNKLLLACLAVRSTSFLGESLEGVVPKAAGVVTVPLGAHELALRFTNARPRLMHYQARVHEVHLFYENILSFMQTVPPQQGGMNAAALLAFNSAPQSSGLYLVKLTIAKDLAQIRAGSGFTTSAAVTSAAGGYGSQAFLSNWLELAQHLRKPVSDHEAQTLALASAPGHASPAKKKPPTSNLNAVYYQNEFVLHVLARIFENLTADQYHQEVNSLTRALDDLVGSWLALEAGRSGGLDVLRQLPLRVRLHTATLLGRFLAFRSSYDLGKEHVQHMSRFEIGRRRAAFFNAFTHLMPTTNEAAALHAGVLDATQKDSVHALEAAVLHGLAQLLAIDPLQDQALEGQLLYFLERVLVLHQRSGIAASTSSGASASTAAAGVAAHMHSGVAHALGTFLRLNPRYAPEFVRMALSETHAHLEAAQADALTQQQQAAAVQSAHAAAAAKAAGKRRSAGSHGSIVLSADERHLIHRDAHPHMHPTGLVISRYYLRACATNWTTDLDLWDRTHGFTKPAMLCVALLAQTSSDPESRALGLLLARALEVAHAKEHPEEAKVKAVRLYAHESPHIFIESAIAYSSSLAKRASYLDHLCPLLAQAVVLSTYTSSSQMECLLRLLQPWVLEVASLLHRLDERHAADATVNAAAVVQGVVDGVIGSLTALTRRAHKVSLLQAPLRALWVALLSNEALTEKRVQMVARHVMDEYASLLEQGDRLKQAQVEQAMVSRSARPIVAFKPTPTVLRAPSVPQGAASPTNLACITSEVTNSQPPAGDAQPAESLKEEEEGKEDAAPNAEALVAGQSAVSLAVDSADSAPDACPSPVQEGLPGVGEGIVEGGNPFGEAHEPSPSPDAVSISELQSLEREPLVRQSSVRATIDAGGLARSQASVPLVSPSNAAQVARSASATAGASVAAADATPRSVAREKALRKFVLVQLLRSPVAREIVEEVVSRLRTYEDQCPRDPDAFAAFEAARASSNTPTSQASIESAEPLTLTERAAFELLANGVFEHRAGEHDEDDLFAAHYPLLLHNAYSLFHATPEGHEMLVHLALVLELYEESVAKANSAASTSANPPARNAAIGSDVLIPLVTRSFPQLRHVWSALALRWACNARDPGVRTVSFQLFQQLEAGSFFFGAPNQDALAQCVLMLAHCLRRGVAEEANLKALVATFISPTAYPYDKAGWTALVSAGWAMLVCSAVPLFSLGLALLQSMFKLSDIARDEQRRWILSLGRFLCRDSTEEVDQAVCEVLFKGLVCAATAQPTLMLLQSMSDIYIGATLPADNKLVVLLSLANVLQRMADLERAHKLVRARAVQSLGGEAVASASLVTAALAKAPASFVSLESEDEKALLRAVDDSANLALLLGQYGAAAEVPQAQRELADLAAVFRNTALSLARLLPDANNDSAPETPLAVEEQDQDHAEEELAVAPATATSAPTRDHAAAQANRNRRLLFKKLLNLMEQQCAADEEKKGNPFGASSSSSSSSSSDAGALDGVHLPSSSQLAGQFFQAFARFFRSPSNYAFALNWFQRMLQHCPTEWRRALLDMLASFLRASGAAAEPHAMENKQFQLLAEIVTQAACSGTDKAEALLAQQVAELLIVQRPIGCTLARHTDLFNFVRPRALAKKPQTSTVLVSGDRADAVTELSEALARMEAHTFPILKSMLSNPRPMTRPMDKASAKLARLAHARTTSSVANAAITVEHARALAAQQVHRLWAAKRLSFASLVPGEPEEVVEVAPPRPAKPTPSPPTIAPRPPTSASVSPAMPQQRATPSPTPAAVVASSSSVTVPAAAAVPSSNPFAGDADDEEEQPVAKESEPAPASESASAPEPVVAAVSLRNSRVVDSDSDDDEIFKAATRRLSNSASASSGPPSQAPSRKASASADRRVSDDDE